MTEFLSVFKNKIKDILNVDQDIEQKLGKLSAKYDSLVKTRPESSIREIREIYEKIHDAIKDLIERDKYKKLSDALEKMLLIEKIVKVGIGTTCSPLVNETVLFFARFCSSRCSMLISRPFVYNQLNVFIRDVKYARDLNMDQLIQSIINYLIVRPHDIALFLLEDDQSPLIVRVIQMIISKYEVNYQIMGILISEAKRNANLANFLTNFTPFALTLVDFVSDCVSTKSKAEDRYRFMFTLDRSLEFCSEFFLDKLTGLFNSKIVAKYIESADPQTCLENSIYILSVFSSQVFVSLVLDKVVPNIPKYLESTDERILYLAIRISSLILEHCVPTLGYNVSELAIDADYTSLLKGEWFVEQLSSTEIGDAEVRTLFYNDISNTVAKKYREYDYTPIAKGLISLLSKFTTNSLKINLALTETFTILSSLWIDDCSFFTLSKSCDDGLYKAISEVCKDIISTVSEKPDVISEIAEAYDSLKTYTVSHDESKKFMSNLVILIEFLKEIHSTVQVKTLMLKRDYSVDI